MSKKQSIVEDVKTRLVTEEFINQHKDKPSDFTRDRILNFGVIFMLILRNSMKSIQLVLNEIFIQGNLQTMVSSSAYVQARKKFKHTAFVELNDVVIDGYYKDHTTLRRWKGYRCLGVDGSMIKLPNTLDMQAEFGAIKMKNQHMEETTYASALFECCYDVLNRIALKSVLAPSASYEVEVAMEMLDVVEAEDLLIYDRAYASYVFLATLVSRQKNYLIRCPRNSFKAAASLFEDSEKTWSKVVYLKVPKDQRKTVASKGLAQEIKVRLVSVVLSTGEIEVLVTSLLDEGLSREDFKEAYHLRWGIEGYYHLLKSRLGIENFTGRTVESVKQDFWSAIFISNLETVLTEETEADMNSSLKEDQYKKKVNKAVSFNVIKNMVFDIFLNEKDQSKTFKKMDNLFKTNAIVVRPERSPPRKKFSSLRSYNFVKRLKKQVF